MGDKSKIEWTDATWNPVTGCTKVSAGCKFCYAERDFHRPYPGRDFTDVRCHPDRLDWPLRWRGSKQAKAEGRGSRIFVNSMSDLFHEKISGEFVARIFCVMRNCPQHTFQILTKRPERALDMLKPKGFMQAMLRNVTLPLANVWLGVSVEDQTTADERIPFLLQTPASVRFVSYEPALGPVDFTFLNAVESTGNAQHPLHVRNNLGGINWIIAGGESGPHARPAHPDWFRSVRDQCQAGAVPFFFKQWGEWGPVFGEVRNCSADIMEWGKNQVRKVGKKRAGRLLDGREWNEYPKGP